MTGQMNPGSASRVFDPLAVRDDAASVWLDMSETWSRVSPSSSGRRAPFGRPIGLVINGRTTVKSTVRVVTMASAAVMALLAHSRRDKLGVR